MADNLTSGIKAAEFGYKVGEKVGEWYNQREAEALSDEQKQAAALIYNAARLAHAVAGLENEFRTLQSKIIKLRVSWSKAQRAELSDQVLALAQKEERLRQLNEAMGFLDAVDRHPGSSWRQRILHRGTQDTRLEDALDALVGIGREVYRQIGAEQNIPTPYGVSGLQILIGDADNQEKVDHVKEWAEDVLGVIDRLTARSVYEAFGRFASVVSQKHGITAPDWTSVQ